MTDPIVGIDLGTSNTVVAHADAAGQVQVLADASGYKIHPSVVSFHPTGGIVVGAAAKQRKVIDPKNTIYSVKRLIGRSFNSPEVQTARQRMPYQIKEGANQLPIVVTRGGEFAVPEISAIILDHARIVASTSLGQEVGRAVVTVPASFNDAQRSATATAGSIAGLTVVRVLNEPTAAALAYGHTRNLKETIAVYDFGGGTFDITILKLADQVYEVLGTAGNTFLGGDDLDERLVDRMVEKFLAENRVDLRTNEVSMMRLRAVAEQTKIELSRRSRAVVRVDEIAYGPKGKPLDLQIEIRRDEFVAQVADIIDQTFPVCEEAMKYAGLDITQIDDVILVGGTTKIPYVRDQVTKFFSKAPRTDVNPEDAVAVGAALQATALERVLNRKRTSAQPVAQAAAIDERTEVPAMVPISEFDAPLTFAGDTQEQTRETQGMRGKRATSGYSEVARMPDPKLTERPVARGEHHDRFEERTPPPLPPNAPVIGRLTKNIAPPGAKTSLGMPAQTQPLPPPIPPKRTAPKVPAARPPGAPSASPQAPTIIVDPSATDPGLQTSEDLDFPNDGTEKGFLDLDDAISPASTAKGFAPASTPTTPTMIAQRPPAQPVAPPTRTTRPSASPPMPSQTPPPLEPPPWPPAPEPAMAPPPWPPAPEPVLAAPAWPPAPQALPAPPAWPPPAASAPTLIAPASAPPQTYPVMKSPVVMDVTPRGLGIGTVAGFCEELIRRNSRVPAEIRKVFTTSRDHQDAVRIIVCQGESRRLDNNVVIGDLLLQGLPRRPRGETSIEVTFQLDANGILQVRARDAQTGNEQRASLDLVGAVPQQDVAASRERVQALRR